MFAKRDDVDVHVDIVTGLLAPREGGLQCVFFNYYFARDEIDNLRSMIFVPSDSSMNSVHV